MSSKITVPGSASPTSPAAHEPVQRTLELRPVIDSEMDADAAWLRASVEAFEPRLRELERRGGEGEASGPDAWGNAAGSGIGARLDLGCGWGCHCCESPLGERPFLDLDRWTGWPARGASALGRDPDEALDRRLRQAVTQAEPIVLGAAVDPYGGESADRARTHRLLGALARLEGAEVALITASPLVLMDLDLLVEVDRGSSLALEMVVPTADPGLAHRLEPGTPTPAERLSALAEFADQGIVTRLRIAPLLPGLADGEESLRSLIAAARAAGVTDVAASPLALPSFWRLGRHGSRRRAFLDWLSREEPELLPRYRQLYRFRRTLRPDDRRATLADFERLRLEHGFPHAGPSRG